MSTDENGFWQPFWGIGANYSDEQQSECSSVEHDFVEADKYCPAVWDSIHCWPATRVGTTVVISCPEKFLDLLENFSPHQFSDFVDNYSDTKAQRTCTNDGEWMNNKSNYTACHDEINLLMEKHKRFITALLLRDIFVFGNLISCVLLVAAFIIFSCFKSLQCSRISIHKNLVMSFFFRSLLIIITFTPLLFGTRFYRNIEWICKTLAVLTQYFNVATIFWMFVEGLFLHNRVAVSVFSGDMSFRLFYAIGWGLPAIICLIWMVCLQLWHNTDCWHGNYELSFFWIILVPIILALLVNAVFLINIIRILVTKLRANKTMETNQVRRAVKAAAILFPLLLMLNTVYFMQPFNNGTEELVYRITHAVMIPLQGIFVSVIYCFTNSEVRLAISKKWQQYRVHRTIKRRSSVRTSSIVVFSSVELERLFRPPPNYTTIIDPLGINRKRNRRAEESTSRTENDKRHLEMIEEGIPVDTRHGDVQSLQAQDDVADHHGTMVDISPGGAATKKICSEGNTTAITIVTKTSITTTRL